MAGAKVAENAVANMLVKNNLKLDIDDVAYNKELVSMRQFEICEWLKTKNRKGILTRKDLDLKLL